jgi:hypothetical protein
MDHATPQNPPRRVLIAVPLHNGVCDAFRRGHMELVAKQAQLTGWAITWNEYGDCGLTIARNNAATRCLVEKFDVLLFLAGDIGFKDDSLSREVKRVLSHFEREGVYVVGGTYLFKRQPLQIVACQDQNRTVDEHGLVTMKWLGMDFCAIRFGALWKIKCMWGLISSKLYGAVLPLSYKSFISNDGSAKGEHWNFFAQTVVHNERAGEPPEFLPEDMYFFRLCREATIPLQLDTRIRLQHWGKNNFDAGSALGIEDAACRMNPPPAP